MNRPHAAVMLVSSMLVALSACPASRPSGAPVLSVSVEQASVWTRNFNPLAPEGLARWPTRAGVYEPLAIFNTATSAWTPWLATKWAWSDDLLSVRFTLRQGVRWSDGQPFTARDVAFTFDLLRRFPALDKQAVWKWVAHVGVVNDHIVEIRLATANVPGFDGLAHQLIVPEHVWKSIDDPLRFANPHPVATGPFTEVNAFRDQVYELGRNRHYWQPGKPAVSAIRCAAYPSNNQAQLALIDGDVDWAGTFIPAVERAYVARDPEHFHYWFPTTGPTVFLYPNGQRPPLHDARVRRAISRAIDRDRLTSIAMEGYTHPADGTGLSDAYTAWRDPTSSSSSWVVHDVDAASRLLDDAGWRRDAAGVRRGPEGQRLSLEIQVVSGWSDWVRAAQLIARDLHGLGITAQVRVYEFATWFSNVQRGQFDLAIGWSLDGPTPYRFYRWLMASDTVQPVGALAAGNWHRIGDSGADALLTALRRESDTTKQRQLVAELQRRFVQVAPAIPLFPSPLWGSYSTRNFVGFPSADDPYAPLAPHAEPSALLVLTRLRPRSN